jgi:hypothetical protein
VSEEGLGKKRKKKSGKKRKCVKKRNSEKKKIMSGERVGLRKRVKWGEKG